jgi:hypothetical protein
MYSNLLSVVGFGAADIAAINSSAPVLAPLVETVVGAVYDKLFSFDVTKVFAQLLMPSRTSLSCEAKGSPENKKLSRTRGLIQSCMVRA